LWRSSNDSGVDWLCRNCRWRRTNEMTRWWKFWRILRSSMHCHHFRLHWIRVRGSNSLGIVSFSVVASNITSCGQRKPQHAVVAGKPNTACHQTGIIIISTTMFMVLSSWQSHCESSPVSFDECRMAPSGRRPKTKPGDLGCESACTGCQKLHPPSPFIITQPESWYPFYRPTEGRRLSRPSWLVTYRDGLPVHRRSPIRVLTGSDVAQLRWSKPTCYH